MTKTLCDFLYLWTILLFSTNASPIFYVNQQTTVDPANADGSENLPFANISSAFIKYPNIPDFVFYLVETDSAYSLFDVLPNNSQITIESLP